MIYFPRKEIIFNIQIYIHFLKIIYIIYQKLTRNRIKSYKSYYYTIIRFKPANNKVEKILIAHD